MRTYLGIQTYLLPSLCRCTGAGMGIDACSQVTVEAIDPVDFVVSADSNSVPLAGDKITCQKGEVEVAQGQYAYCCNSSTSQGPAKETGGLTECTASSKPLTCLVSLSPLLWPVGVQGNLSHASKHSQPAAAPQQVTGMRNQRHIYYCHGCGKQAVNRRLIPWCAASTRPDKVAASGCWHAGILPGYRSAQVLQLCRPGWLDCGDQRASDGMPG